MERKTIDGMDNASLMQFVQKARGLFNKSTETDIDTPAAWALFHNLRYAEGLMKFRNLPLDDERLGERFDIKHFRALTLLEPTEKADQENDDQKNSDNP